MKKMQLAVIEAQKRANETQKKLAIVDHYKNSFDRKLQFIVLTSILIVSLSYKCIERMDTLHLELSYQMLRLEQRMNHAATRIGCIYRGVKTRRRLHKLLKARKSATLLI